MSITALTSAKGITSTGGPLDTFDSSGCNALILVGGFGGSPTVSDNKGNTFTLAATNGTVRLYYCLNAAVGTNHVITIGGGNTASSWVVLGASGVKLTAAYSSPGGTAISNGTTAAFGVNGNPPEDNCLCVFAASLAAVNIGSVSAANGWTIPQWNNGAPGTNYASFLAYKIQTTATQIPAAEVYANWTNATSGSQILAYFKAEPAAPPEGIVVTSPSAFEVHQRAGTTGSIQIAFTTTGSTDDIEARFNGGAFQTIKAAHAAGSGTGTLTGQAQGQGPLEVRKKTLTSTSATVANVGIGEIIGQGGDSNGEGRGSNAQAYAHATLKAAKFRQDNLWAEGIDPIDTGTSSGNYLPLLATLLMADLGVPVGFLTASTGSTDVAGSANSWAKPGGEYTNMANMAANSTVTGMRCVLMSLGPNAVVNATTLSKATYNAAIDTLAANMATDLPGAPKIHVGVFGEVSTGSPPDRVAALNNLRGGIMEAWGDNPNVKPGPVLIDLDFSDGVHAQSDAQLLIVAQRTYLALKEAHYGGAAGSGRGPRITSASWNVARTQITVVFDRALKTGLTHSTACWRVLDNAAVMTVSGVAYHGTDANALVLTLSTAAVGAAGTGTISYGHGDTAVGQVVPKSTDIALPVGGPIQLPAEPFYGVGVAEHGTAATTVTVTLTTDGTTPAANLTGLRWAFFDQAQPSGFNAPTAKGSGATTNASGVFSVNIAGTALNVGGTGWLEVSDSDGTVGQVGGHKRASGPVTVS